MSGRIDYIHYIRSYRLNYSLDGSTWISYNNSQIFNGNIENKQPVKQKFEPFMARAVRLLPVSWNAGICGHFEFFISKPIYNNVLPSGTLISAISSGFKVTVSSMYSSACNFFRIGLDNQDSIEGCGSWCAGVSDKNQWILITSVKSVLWKKIGTKGDSKNDNWITSFYVMYSEDGSDWNYYKNMLVFNANSDRNTLVG